MRKVFLDNLPRLKNNRICWADTIGFVLKFVYDDTEGIFIINDYKTDGNAPQLYLDYNGNKEWVYASRLIHCRIGKFIKIRKEIVPRKDNLKGQRFGKLVVLEDDGNRSDTGQILWKCLCDCGKITHVVGCRLKNGHTKSCGCMARNHFKPKTKTENDFKNTAISVLIGRYKAKAKERGLCWNIDKDTFIKTIESPCYYCGIKSSLVWAKQYYKLEHNGIDRIDSSKGYDLDNICPCCKICNMAKSDMSQNDFYQYIDRITKFNKK